MYPLVTKMGPQEGLRPSIIAKNVGKLVISKKIVLEMVMRKTWSLNIRLLEWSPTPWKHKPPVTDKSLSDFMYKNFKQTEKLKKKYMATKTKLKKTKQELEDVKSRKLESTYTTTENTSPKKMVTFAKNTMNKKTPQIGKVSTKVKVRKPTVTTAATTSSSTTKTKVKTEPVSIIESGDTSDDDEGDEGENITEVDSGDSSSSVSTESDTDK